MTKALMLALFVVAVGLFGWEMNRYATSGTEIVSIPLTASSGTVDNLILTPEMSKARLILATSYEVTLQEGMNRLYSYQVTLRDQGGELLVGEERTHEKSLGDQGSSFEAGSEAHIIGTFDVWMKGAFQLNWQLTPRQANLEQASLKIRRNVSDLNISLLIGAGLLFALGCGVLFVSRRFKPKDME